MESAASMAAREELAQASSTLVTGMPVMPTWPNVRSPAPTPWLTWPTKPAWMSVNLTPASFMAARAATRAISPMLFSGCRPKGWRPTPRTTTRSLMVVLLLCGAEFESHDVGALGTDRGLFDDHLEIHADLRLLRVDVRQDGGYVDALRKLDLGDDVGSGDERAGERYTGYRERVQLAGPAESDRIESFLVAVEADYARRIEALAAVRATAAFERFLARSEDEVRPLHGDAAGRCLRGCIRRHRKPPFGYRVRTWTVVAAASPRTMPPPLWVMPARAP